MDPDGYFINGILWLEAPGSVKGTVPVAKGFRITPADLRSADNGLQNHLHERLRRLLHILGPERRVQVQWSVDSDYQRELAAYKAITDRADPSADAWSIFVRDLTHSAATRQMEGGQLRRERLTLFVGQEIACQPPASESQEAFIDRITHAQATEFEQIAHSIRQIFPDAVVEPLDDIGHYGTIARFLDPGLPAALDLAAGYYPLASIQEHCAIADFVTPPDVGFHYGSFYYQIFSLHKWPKATHPGIVRALTSLPFNDYRLTLNIKGRSVSSEITTAENRINRLRTAGKHDNPVSAGAAADDLEGRVRELNSGYLLPFDAQFIVTVWSESKEDLASRATAIKNAIAAMDGAKAYQATDPAHARNLWHQTWPGNLFGDYAAPNIYGEDTFLADLIPWEATFTGDLAEADAIVHGPSRQLVGVQLFAPDGTPHHGLVVGTKGSGKSVFLDELLSQAGCRNAYTAIIEEGDSHRTIAQLLGGESLVIRIGSSLTLNYLDTGGLPLTNEHISDCADLLLRMVGLNPDPDINALRRAYLIEYLQQRYQTTYNTWAAAHAAKNQLVARRAVLIAQRARSSPELGLLDHFVELRDLEASDPQQVQSMLAEIPDSEVSRYLTSPTLKRSVRDVAYAFIDGKSQPTHSDLVNTLSNSPHPDHVADKVKDLAAFLKAWGRQGAFGVLFDGQGNRRLSSRCDHIELGEISEGNTQLKSVIMFLLAAKVRQHVTSLPRTLRKVVLFEEAARFLAADGGSEIVKRFYAQLRKSGCCCIVGLQQYSQIEDEATRSVILGNSGARFFFRQGDPRDLSMLARDSNLSVAAERLVATFQAPAQQRGPRHSQFLYSCDSQPVPGPAAYFASPALLYAAESTGPIYEEKKSALRDLQGQALLEAVVRRSVQSTN